MIPSNHTIGGDYMGRFRSSRGDDSVSREDAIDSARRDFASDLELLGWTICDTPETTADYLWSKCELEGVLHIESTMAEYRVVLASSLERVSNDDDVRYGARPSFDTSPSEEEEKAIAAHLIAIQMRYAELALSDIPLARDDRASKDKHT